MSRHIFNNSAPTIGQINCIYLYDAMTPPPQGTMKTWRDVVKIAKQAHARGKREVIINKSWFMQHGGGRFAKPTLFRIVRNFLAPEAAHNLEMYGGGEKDRIVNWKRFAPREEPYTTKDIFKEYGVEKLENQYISIEQYYLELKSKDFADRCEVFGSSGFRINEEAEFYVFDPKHPLTINGKVCHRAIKNIWLEPVKDNFDYESTSEAASYSNSITEPLVDPLQIGQKVDILFEGQYSDPKIYTDNDWDFLRNEHREFFKKRAGAFSMVAGFKIMHPEKMQMLYDGNYLYSLPDVPKKPRPNQAYESHKLYIPRDADNAYGRYYPDNPLPQLNWDRAKRSRYPYENGVLHKHHIPIGLDPDYL